MANETNDFSATVSSFVETAGKLVQQQFDVVSGGVQAIVQLAEPLAKTAIDLVGSASNTIGHVFESAASAIAPKK